MNYRKLGKIDIKVSEIGLGCEHLQGKDYSTVESVINTAIENGINIMDIFMSEPEVRSNIGKVLLGKRNKVVLQGHIGSAWIDGQYCRTRTIENCKKFFEDFMERLQTDYVDIGMIHFVDTENDYKSIFDTDIIKYALELKQKGIIKAIGMSSHDPVSALKAVKTGLIDVLMFSINPAYDILPENTLIDDLFNPKSYMNNELNGINNIRDELYKTCESVGTSITVMKSLGAGALLDAQTSPFGLPLTVSQCIHYCLTRPAVSSVLIGVQSPEEIYEAIKYETLSDKEKDYSDVLSNTPKYSLKGKCMYCNHCLPCPSKIDIAKVNKYLDLALINNTLPATVKEHYNAMETNASMCIECGSCEKNCPFDVKIIEKMRKAKEIFSI